MFQVQAKPCSTCIYRKDSALALEKLEAQVADKHGGFRAHRVCHHAGGQVCCAGFWRRHKNEFPMGQIAQRLGMVQLVTIDKLKGG